MDDDCDGAVDEGLVPAICGIGACTRTGTSCLATSCIGGVAAAEICNGVDDDCDGQVDEQLPASSCGVGACARTGSSCLVGSCLPGLPATESCNGFDDDCDGMIDNDCMGDAGVVDAGVPDAGAVGELPDAGVTGPRDLVGGCGCTQVPGVELVGVLALLLAAAPRRSRRRGDDS